MQSNNNIIGKRINAVLALRGKKQKDLANYLQVKPNVVSYFCTGDRVPNVEQLRKIAEYLSVSSDYLIGLSENPTIEPDIQNACKVTGLREPVIEHIKYLSEFPEDNYFTSVLEQLILGLDHSILFLVEDYHITNYKISKYEEYLIKKYCEYKKLDISDREIEEKGLYAINDLSKQAECKTDINFVLAEVGDDVEYKKYKIAKYIQDIFLSIDDYSFSEEIAEKAKAINSNKKARALDIMDLLLKEAEKHGEHNTPKE